MRLQGNSTPPGSPDPQLYHSLLQPGVTPKTVITQTMQTPAHLQDAPMAPFQILDENQPLDFVESAGKGKKAGVKSEAKIDQLQVMLLREKVKAEELNFEFAKRLETDRKERDRMMMENQANIAVLETEKSELAEKLRLETCKAMEYQKQIFDLTSENARIMENSQKLEQDITDMTGLLSKNKGKRLDFVSSKATLEAESAAVKEALQRKETELSKVKAKCARAKERLQQVQSWLTTKEKDSERIEETHQRQISDYEKQQIHEIEILQKSIFDHKKSLANAQERVKVLGEAVEEERKRREAAERDRETLRRRMEEQGIAVPRYEIVPWILAFFLGILMNYVLGWMLHLHVEVV